MRDAPDQGDAHKRPEQRHRAMPFDEILQRRATRRQLLRTVLGGAALVGGGGLRGGLHAAVEQARSPGFEEVKHGVDKEHHVPPGFDTQTLIRWGDPVVTNAPPFDPGNLNPAAQELQFGYNNDYLAYLSLPFGSESSDHALLCINHEFTCRHLMFPGEAQPDFKAKPSIGTLNKARMEVEMAAHGCSVIEIARSTNTWHVVADSPFARRISARSTAMHLSGPAAGHSRLKTSSDASGTKVIGTINNCAGGVTAWGTYLSAEENFHGYFWGELTETHPEYTNYKRYSIPGHWYAWGKQFFRWNINAEMNEANRFGWIVELDPFDTNSTPVKRTALGRFKHEGAETIVNHDGRVIVYMGDDEHFEYVYRYVSHDVFHPTGPRPNRDLLDHGTLSVAQFSADGTLKWLPLVFGHGPLNADNDFTSQADVLIETRRAADLLGATPMDRPEDVEADPYTHRVYVMLTNNIRRRSANETNNRAPNLWGHILELIPPNEDHSAEEFNWELLVSCGDPSKAHHAALWNPQTSENGWFVNPDNCAIDTSGRLWIATDQGPYCATASGTSDGLWLLDTQGTSRGTGHLFFRAPVGAEVCGPVFTPDRESLFLSVQHPGSDGTRDLPGFERDSSMEDPATRWPDFDPTLPPRPAVVVVTRRDGGGI